MKKILLAYIPVLHKGYLDLIQSEKFDKVYVMGEDVISDLNIDYIKRKDLIRAIPAELIVSAIKSWGITDEVYSIDLLELEIIRSMEEIGFVMPDEDISHEFVKKYIVDKDVFFKSVFLRWHRDNVVDQTMAENFTDISVSNFDYEMMGFATQESLRSADWWRQIGAVLVRNQKILFVTHNQHLPEEQSPNFFGDPRAIFKRGVHIELSTSEHAEASIIAEAANKGVSLRGTSLYSTDFPCPPCAKLIAHSGIKKLFFKNGYAVLDGALVLERARVEITRVQF